MHTNSELFVPFGVLLFHMMFFTTLRNITEIFLPVSFIPLVGDFISTVELCSESAEMGFIKTLHGKFAYRITQLWMCFWRSQVCGNSESCPCGSFEDIVLQRRRTIGNIVMRLSGQVLGAVASVSYIKFIWSLNLLPEHQEKLTSGCIASLKVTMLLGALIECVITFLSRSVCFALTYKNKIFSGIISSVLSVFLVYLAANSTGAYFNPLLASVQNLGCQGNTLVEHIVVYWVGPLAGGLIARKMYFSIFDL